MLQYYSSNDLYTIIFLKNILKQDFKNVPFLYCEPSHLSLTQVDSH